MGHEQGTPVRRAAIQVGRIAGLSVALGVGAAVAGGTAVAWAGSGAGSSERGPAAITSAGPSAPKPAAAAAKATNGSPRGAGPASSAPAPARAVAVGGTTTPSAAATDGPAATPDSGAGTAILPSPGRELRSGVQRQDRSATASAVPAALAATSSPAAVAATQPSTLTSTPIGWVTGQNNSGYPGASWAQTNNTAGFGIYGADLGIMWQNAVNGMTQVAFGDTFSGPNKTGTWRSNVLLLSNDKNLTDGMTLLPTGYAYQFIPSAPSALFPILGSEVTIIPTSAIEVDDQNYVNYMSVKSWDSPGRWTTNYSAISMYDPTTDKWVLQPATIRPSGWLRSSTPFVAGDQNFQQSAYVLQPADQVPQGGTQYLYEFGTPSGRAGSAFLARVPADSVTDLSSYQYWNGSTWVTDMPADATAVLGDSTNSTGPLGWLVDLANSPTVAGGYFAGLLGAKTGGNVSEMSVQYNDYLNEYVALYANGSNNVVLRTAAQPQGPWSAPITIATSLQYPGLYAPMIHPLSGTGELVDDNGNPDVSNLYWDMSLSGNYNVVLMQTNLSSLKTTAV